MHRPVPGTEAGDVRGSITRRSAGLPFEVVSGGSAGDINVRGAAAITRAQAVREGERGDELFQVDGE